MSSTTRTRLVPNNQIVLDQADFFEADGFTRVLGIVPTQLSCQVFFQNTVQPWALVQGTNLPDAQVVSGRVYWSEVTGMPGFYNVRWRPNAVGYWRIILTYALGQQIVGQEYDVTGVAQVDSGGLKPSFMKPHC